MASNHPGATDAFAVIASLPRDDAALVISDVPITRALPHTSRRFIFVSGEMESHGAAVREMTDHLERSRRHLPQRKPDTKPAIVAEMGLPPDWTARGDGEPWQRPPSRAGRGRSCCAEAGARVPDPTRDRQWRTAASQVCAPLADALHSGITDLGTSAAGRGPAGPLHQIRTGDSLGLRPHVRLRLPVEGELAGVDRETMSVIVERASQLLVALAS